jgi:probable nitrogen fixation protein
MSQVVTLEKPLPSELQHPFLQELVQQIRLADTWKEYHSWSDEILVNQLIISLEKDEISSKNLNVDPLNQLVTSAFYQAIGKAVEERTGHVTETFVHLKNKEFSSAVVFCGGVLVLYALIWGYRSFGFLSLEELLEASEIYISDAVAKASRYLDFVE